jgi:hypothetical protein
MPETPVKNANSDILRVCFDLLSCRVRIKTEKGHGAVETEL